MIDVRWNWIIVFWPAVWLLAGLFVVSSPEGPMGRLLQAGAIFAIGVSIQAMAILMHEALHGNLFRNGTLDRIAMFILGVPAFFSGEAYRVVHLHHHRHTRTELDQDEISNLCGSDRQYRLLFYLWFLLGTILYFFIVPLKALQFGTPRERRRIVSEYLLIFAIYGLVIGTAVSTGHARELLLCWLLPALVAVGMSNIRGLSEHLCTSKGDVWTRSRTTISTRLVSFAMLNLNYHLEHHLFPGVPWYNLRKLHELLQDEYAGRSVFVQRSYLRFAWRALVGGPDQTIRDRALAE